MARLKAPIKAPLSRSGGFNYIDVERFGKNGYRFIQRGVPANTPVKPLPPYQVGFLRATEFVKNPEFFMARAAVRFLTKYDYAITAPKDKYDWARAALSYGGELTHHWGTYDDSANIGQIMFRFDEPLFSNDTATDTTKYEWIYIPDPFSGSPQWPVMVGQNVFPRGWRSSLGLRAQNVPASDIWSMPQGKIAFAPAQGAVLNAVAPGTLGRPRPRPMRGRPPRQVEVTEIVVSSTGVKYRTQLKPKKIVPRRRDKERKLLNVKNKALHNAVGTVTEVLDALGCVAKATGTYGGPAGLVSRLASGHVGQLDVDKLATCLVTNHFEDMVIGKFAKGVQKSRRDIFNQYGRDVMPGLRGFGSRF